MKIIKKYPINYNCLIFNSDLSNQLEKEFGKSMHKFHRMKSGQYDRDYGLYDFISDKIGKLEFPKKSLSDVGYEFQINKYGKDFSIKEFIWERQSIIGLPITYDNSNDQKQYDTSREIFLKKMKSYGEELTPKEEKLISFGPMDFGWINEFLSFMYEKYKPYYINGFLPIFNDLEDQCYWINDKQNICRPYPKSYYLSEIVDYMFEDYQIDISKLYEWIIECDFIEGRYWERYIEYNPEFESFRKTKCNIKIGNALHLMMIDLDMEHSDFQGFDYIPLYIDYYKKVDSDY